MEITGINFKKALRINDITQQEAANRLGVSRQTVNTWTKLAVLDDDILHRVKQKLDIDLKALLAEATAPDEPNTRFIGNVVQSDEHEETSFVDIGEGQYVMIVPLVNEYAYAGYLAGYKDREFIEELPRHTIIVSKHHRGQYQAFEVKGESMEDPARPRESIFDGSIVTGRQIQPHLWTSKLHTHRWQDFVIVHREGILTKRIKEHHVTEGVLILESLNPDKTLYPDREVHLDDVYQIFNIINKSLSL